MTQLKKVLFITVFCNSLVWYDYALYGSLVGIISTLFFPDLESKARLLSGFAVFSVGFIARPIGSLFFGHIGDKYGRRGALLLSVICMSLPVAIVAILPTYKSIGIAATMLLIITRIAQGFALGGESGNAVFLIEYSPKNRISFYSSFEVVSAVIGALASTIAIFACKFFLGAEKFASWGWRLPFIFGAVIGVVGSVLRYAVKETPEFTKERNLEIFPIAKLFSSYKKKLITAIGIDSTEETSLYMFLVFLQGYLIAVIGAQSAYTELLHIAFLLALAIFTLLFAFIADIFGRERILFLGFICAVLFGYPIFAMIDHGTFFSIFAAQSLLIIIVAASLGPVSAQVYKIFPLNIVYTGLAFSRNVSAALFGGLAPTVSVFLVNMTGSNRAAALYLILSGIVGLISLIDSCIIKKSKNFITLKSEAIEKK